MHNNVTCTPGCASFEVRTPHPQHPPWAKSTETFHKPQHPSTGHPIAFGFESGGRRQAPRPKPPEICTWYCLYTWYQVFRYSGSSTFHLGRISPGAHISPRAKAPPKYCMYQVSVAIYLVQQYNCSTRYLGVVVVVRFIVGTLFQSRAPGCASYILRIYNTRYTTGALLRHRCALCATCRRILDVATMHPTSTDCLLHVFGLEISWNIPLVRIPSSRMKTSWYPPSS